ncbi:MAG: hypothetical protein HYV09_14820 [Deltaproteobacteria bacterium]|nr:hypothetical protein [Deltaproteobacteria bacterium]
MRAAVVALSGAGLIACASSASTTLAPDAGGDATSDVRDARDAGGVREDPPPPPVPPTLAETGLYEDFAAKRLSKGVVAFDVRWPLWSDGAEKQRYLYVPAGKTIDIADPDHWAFPAGTKAWKEFRVGGKLIETRYVEKTGEPPIGWRYVAYAWSEDQATAVAAPGGVRDALGTTHDIPDQAACEQCHSGTRDGIIGVGNVQLSDGKTLASFTSLGLLPAVPAEYRVPGTGVVQEVLGYLHGNCGYCHSDVGRWSTARGVRLRLLFAISDPAKTPTYLTTINVPMSHSDTDGEPFIGVVPGDPSRSHLYQRITKRDFWAMPPVGSEVVDEVAAAKVKSWIEGLPR